MVRIYALVVHFSRGQYETLSYFLDPAAAADAALKMSKTLARDSYVLVQQLDVFPNSFNCSHLLRVDSADLCAKRSQTR